MKKNMLTLSASCALLTLGSVCWTHSAFGSAQEEGEAPTQAAPAINPLPIIDTLKIVLEEMRAQKEQGAYVVVQKKRRSVASVRSELDDLKILLANAQEDLTLLLDQKSQICVLTSAYVDVLSEMEDSDDEEADALRDIIQGVYAEAGVTSRRVLEEKLKEKRAQINSLKQKSTAREALLKDQGDTFVPTQEEVLGYLQESKKNVLDLGNPATLGEITKILRDVYCIE
ncbi:MAG: hypothetical protein C0514_01560 [Candidatus Puniceispirillum sp.]|nr:hypothetical protein [Candidatus Puniceispirillum sp.]